MSLNTIHVYISYCKIFSRGHATLELAVSVGRKERRSVTFLIFEVFCSCPPDRDCLAVYPALFSHEAPSEYYGNQNGDEAPSETCWKAKIESR